MIQIQIISKMCLRDIHTPFLLQLKMMKSWIDETLNYILWIKSGSAVNKMNDLLYHVYVSLKGLYFSIQCVINGITDKGQIKSISTSHWTKGDPRGD